MEYSSNRDSAIHALAVIHWILSSQLYLTNAYKNEYNLNPIKIKEGLDIIKADWELFFFKWPKNIDLDKGYLEIYVLRSHASGNFCSFLQLWHS